MTIDPQTLPDGTLIRCASGHHIAGIGCDVKQVFAPVPDGMTVEDATQALADHVQWVPMEWDNIPDGARWQHSGIKGGESAMRRPFLIHPDDVPTDPDAELIEAMAKAIARKGSVSGRAPVAALDLHIARAALAVVREHKAGAR